MRSVDPVDRHSATIQCFADGHGMPVFHSRRKRQSFAPRTEHQRLSGIISQHRLVANDSCARSCGNSVGVPVVVWVAMSNKNVRDAWPFRFRYQGSEPEVVQQ